MPKRPAWGSSLCGPCQVHFLPPLPHKMPSSLIMPLKQPQDLVDEKSTPACLPVCLLLSHRPCKDAIGVPPLVHQQNCRRNNQKISFAFFLPRTRASWIAGMASGEIGWMLAWYWAKQSAAEQGSVAKVRTNPWSLLLPAWGQPFNYFQRDVHIQPPVSQYPSTSRQPCVVEYSTSRGGLSQGAKGQLRMESLAWRDSQVISNNYADLCFSLAWFLSIAMQQ